MRFKFERASFRSSGGRGVDRLLVMGNRDAHLKGRPCYRESRYRKSRVYFGPQIDSPKHKFSDARWTSRWKFQKFSGAHCDIQERHTFIKMQMNVGNECRYSWYKVTDGATGKLNGKIQKINFSEQTKQAILHEMWLKKMKLKKYTGAVFLGSVLHFHHFCSKK